MCHFADSSHQYQFLDFSSTKGWTGDGSFILHTARCGTTPVETKNEMIFSAIFEECAGMAKDKGCERNPLAQYTFEPIIAYLQNLGQVFQHVY